MNNNPNIDPSRANMEMLRFFSFLYYGDCIREKLRIEAHGTGESLCSFGTITITVFYEEQKLYDTEIFIPHHSHD